MFIQLVSLFNEPSREDPLNVLPTSPIFKSPCQECWVTIGGRSESCSITLQGRSVIALPYRVSVLFVVGCALGTTKTKSWL